MEALWWLLLFRIYTRLVSLLVLLLRWQLFQMWWRCRGGQHGSIVRCRASSSPWRPRDAAAACCC
jgi:hypothetical protein